MTTPAKIWREAPKRYRHLGKIGKILSFTKIQTPVEGFEKYLPYFVAIVQLEDGEKVTGQLKIKNEKLKMKNGDKVIGIIRRLKEPDEKGLIEYGVKWKIID